MDEKYVFSGQRSGWIGWTRAEVKLPTIDVKVEGVAISHERTFQLFVEHGNA